MNPKMSLKRSPVQSNRNSIQICKKCYRHKSPRAFEKKKVVRVIELRAGYRYYKSVGLGLLSKVVWLMLLS